MTNKLAELLGFGLVVSFLYFIWPPLVLLGVGALLIAWSNLRTAPSGRLGAAFGAAVAAAASTYRASRVPDHPPADLRPVRSA